jgi:hypothetical protein
VGATVRVRTGEHVQAQAYLLANSYASSYVGPLTFGLGDAARVDTIEVIWPGGRRTEVSGIDANREITLRPDGEFTTLDSATN